MKKNLTKLLLILSAVIICACSTIAGTSELTLPPEPQRQEIQVPYSTQDYLELLAYYEKLVEEWELWAEAANKIVKEK